MDITKIKKLNYVKNVIVDVIVVLYQLKIVQIVKFNKVEMQKPLIVHVNKMVTLLQQIYKLIMKFVLPALQDVEYVKIQILA